MTRSLILAGLAALLAAALPGSPAARGLGLLNMSEDDRKEIETAQEELRELERRIKRKEIPPIEFELDSAKLRPYSKEALDIVADVMFRFPELKLMVFGHTCDLGSDEYNQVLSQKRAEAVKTYLVSVGVYGEFIKAKGFGESKPLVPNESEEERAMNRRVEFVLTKRWWDSIF